MEWPKPSRKSRKGGPEEAQKQVPTTLNLPIKSDISANLTPFSCTFGTNIAHSGNKTRLEGPTNGGEGTPRVGGRAYQGGIPLLPRVLRG